MSRSSVSLPEASILSFSHRCGSGVKGANPRVRHSIIRIDRGIRLNKLHMVDISVEKGGFILPNNLCETIVSLKEHIMKSKTYPEIGFLRLRDIIGDGNNQKLYPEPSLLEIELEKLLSNAST
jgi:hypothetical protein